MRILLGRKSRFVQDVFQTTIYAGNASSQTITNGLDYVNEDGLVWIKARSASAGHYLADTVSGVGYSLRTDVDDSQSSVNPGITEFLTTGFSLNTVARVNQSYNYVSWSFLRGVRFFDFSAVTKASGSTAVVSFPNLVDLGMVVVKRLDASGDWYVWHRELTAGHLLKMNLGDEEAALGHVTVSGTAISLVDGVISNGSYMVFAFAHDSVPSGKIQAGSYTGNGSTTGPEVNLGWRPQYLMLKVISGERKDWAVYDNKRNPSNPRNNALRPNDTSAEATIDWDVDFTATGFQIKTDRNVNTTGFDYAYLAIREEE